MMNISYFILFWLRTTTENTCKILKLDCKTLRKLLDFFSSKRVGTKHKICGYVAKDKDLLDTK